MKMRLTRRTAFLAIGSFILLVNAASVKPQNACTRWTTWSGCSTTCGPGVVYRRCFLGLKDQLTLSVKACQRSPCAPNLSRFMLYNTSYKSWTAASDDCKRRGGWLATINSPADQNVVEALVRRTGCPTSCRFTQVWIGGKHDGSWKWVRDNFVINIGYTNWHNLLSDQILSNMRCLSLQPNNWGNGFGQWYRYVCSYRRPYLCEFPVIG